MRTSHLVHFVVAIAIMFFGYLCFDNTWFDLPVALAIMAGGALEFGRAAYLANKPVPRTHPAMFEQY